MEETRQHSALTQEQWYFAAAYFSGHLKLLAGIVSTLLGHPKGIAWGFLGFAVSKIVVAAWSIARPEVQVVRQSNTTRLVIAITWAIVAVFLFSIEIPK